MPSTAWLQIQFYQLIDYQTFLLNYVHLFLAYCMYDSYMMPTSDLLCYCDFLILMYWQLCHPQNRNNWYIFVTLVGLKPTTLGLEVQCSIRLSYKAIVKKLSYTEETSTLSSYPLSGLPWQPCICLHMQWSTLSVIRLHVGFWFPYLSAKTDTDKSASDNLSLCVWRESNPHALRH